MTWFDKWRNLSSDVKQGNNLMHRLAESFFLSFFLLLPEKRPQSSCWFCHFTEGQQRNNNKKESFGLLQSGGPWHKCVDGLGTSDFLGQVIPVSGGSRQEWVLLVQGSKGETLSTLKMLLNLYRLLRHGRPVMWLHIMRSTHDVPWKRCYSSTD